MESAHVLLLVVAGLAAGAVNAIAGGGSLITFPSLLAVGLGPVEANVTNSVSVFPGYVSSVAGSRAALALIVDEPLRRINALKNVLSATVGLVTLVVFAVFARVDWAAAVTIAPATIVGGYVGARLARRLPTRVLKHVIVTFGAVIGLVLLYRAFVG